MSTIIALLWTAVMFDGVQSGEEWDMLPPAGPSKWDRFCSRHPFIDRVWPWVFAVLLWGGLFGIAAAGYPLFELVMGWVGK